MPERRHQSTHMMPTTIRWSQLASVTNKNCDGTHLHGNPLRTDPANELYISCKQPRSIVVWSACGVILLHACPLAYLTTFASRAQIETPKRRLRTLGLPACMRAQNNATRQRHHGTSTNDTLVSRYSNPCFFSQTDGVSESAFWRQQITNVPTRVGSQMLPKKVDIRFGTVSGCPPPTTSSQMVP